MASQVNLTLNENNDETINVTVTTNVPTAGTVLNLTGMSAEAFLKISAATPDADATTWKGTTTGGQITITSATNGQLSIAIPASAITASKGWWRLDILSSGSLRKTAVYGTTTILDL